MIWKDTEPHRPVINGRQVLKINSLLRESSNALATQPKQLAANKTMVFTGTHVYGKGFVISSSERDHFIKLDPNSAEIIRPFLKGEDINRHPLHAHSEWIIDFGDMPEEEARRWPDLFSHLEKTVKIERMKQTKQVHEPCFWKHWDKRSKLYSKLSTLEYCLVHAFIGKHIGFAFVPADQIIATPQAVWPTHSKALFSVLQSSFHAVWVFERSSKMGQSIRYAPSDCFQTFPLPLPLDRKELHEVGERYLSFRGSIMASRQEGMTTIYNQFHDPRENSEDIKQLRRLQCELDSYVVLAYGWGGDRNFTWLL